MIDSGGDGGGGGSGGGGETGPHATIATLSCNPAQLEPTAVTTCTATVIDTAAVPTAPSGSVAFSSDNAAQIFSSGTCDLSAGAGGQFSCSVGYRPLAPGVHNITATYGGDGSHKSSPPISIAITSTAPAGECGGDDEGEDKEPVPPPEPTPQPEPSPEPEPTPLPDPTLPAEPSTAAAPGTMMLKRLAQKQTANRRAKFVFGSDQTDSTFECRLDRQPFENCTSPFRAKVKPGRHTLLVRAIGSDGTMDPTPAVVRWTVSR